MATQLDQLSHNILFIHSFSYESNKHQLRLAWLNLTNSSRQGEHRDICQQRPVQCPPLGI